MKLINKYPFDNSMINKNRLSNKSKSLPTSPDTPKDKTFRILNLSELLDYKVLPPSEMIMRDRLSSQQSTRNQGKLKFQNYHSNSVKSNQRTPLKINYQHYRAKSTSTIKNYYDSIKSPFQSKANCVKLSNQKNNPILIKSKSLILSPQVQGVSLASSFKSQQLLSKSSFKIQNFAFRQEVYASSKYKSNQAMLVMSLEYKKNSEQNPDTQQMNHQKEKQKIKFLKKGSSLQKQIVVNLLKNKLIKEHEENTKKQYTQCDILSMVKLYKSFVGFTKSAIKNPQIVRKPKVDTNSKYKFKKQNSTLKDQEFLRTYQSLPENIVEKYSKPIVGWETAPEFDIEDLKNQQNTQITMDHSYGLS